MRTKLAIAFLPLLIGIPVQDLVAQAFDPANSTIAKLRLALDGGQVSSEQLVLYYRDRIERFDKREPFINAMITLNPHAVDEARRMDLKAKGTPVKSLLYGIPFIAKDNYDTAGMPTSGGSAALKHSVPNANAFVIQKMLDQGAILIGKSNMSELAASYGRLGYSSAGGQTLNPYNTARDVSGSSSGSAAAVAADFAAFALGTDTSGSVRGPASAAGLIGLRPTLGLISRSGVIPLSLSFDTSGVLTRSVEDLAIVLDAIAMPDSKDAATLQRSSTRVAYRSALGTRSLRGAKLGVISNFRGGNAEVDSLEKTVLKRLESEGAILIPVSLPKQFERLWELVLSPVVEAEFKPQFERYLKSLSGDEPKTLGKLIDISSSQNVQGSANPVNPARLQALREADATEMTDSPGYIYILNTIIPSIRQELQELIKARHLQALVFSTVSCPAAPLFNRPDPSYVCYSTDPYKASYIASAAGYPEISIPAGRVAGNIPVGISFMGLPYHEEQLLSLAYAFEASSPRFSPPDLH